jgi:LytS/YehU family sensor histidine kinase
VKLIDDLAEEFRTLAAISGEKQVPLGRELELCRVHLRVMRARTDLDWKLAVDGVDPAAQVPPALFLTLIENGFSHQRARKDATTFALQADARGDGVRYTFLSPGTVTPETSRVTGGTGLRYVRARLEESFPGAWSLSQGPVSDGWQTVIEVWRAERNGGAE